jgi:hypothetical protein
MVFRANKRRQTLTGILFLPNKKAGCSLRNSLLLKAYRN